MRESPPPAPHELTYTVDGEPDGVIRVVPSETPYWSWDYGAYVCRYATTDERIPRDFWVWIAVWVDGRWEADEI